MSAGSGARIGRVYQPTYRDKKTGERKVSEIYWIEYWRRGQQFRESSHSRKERDALNLLKQRVGEIASGRFVGPAADRVIFDDLERMLLDDYRVNGRKSLRRAEASMKRLRQVFVGVRAVDISGDAVTSYVARRLEAKAKPATVQKELAALRRAYTLAVRSGKLSLAQLPYIPSLEIRNTRTGFFEEPDFRAILEHLSDDVRPVAEFMYWTGWRSGETLSLEWRQVDFVRGVVRLDVETTKNDEGRELPFALLPELRDVLDRQRARTEAVEKTTGQIIPYVFHRGGRPIRDFLDGWHSACEKAGLAGRIPHDFRRTAVRRYERAGVPRSVAMKLTGHKTESVYRRYAIVSESDLREAITKVAALTKAESRQSRKVTPIRRAETATRKVPAKSGRLDGNAAGDAMSANV